MHGGGYYLGVIGLSVPCGCVVGVSFVIEHV